MNSQSINDRELKLKLKHKLGITRDDYDDYDKRDRDLDRIMNNLT